MKLKIILLSIPFLILSCGVEKESNKGSEEYIQSVNEWSSAREERLTRENGWLNLAGLFWLDEGENKFGSDKSSDIIFPEEAPDFAGAFILEDSIVTVIINDEAPVLIDSQKIKRAELRADISGNPQMMDYKNLRWFLIKRGNQYGIRLRDLNSEAVNNFEGIDRYPVNEEWKIAAEFIPFDEPRKINIPTILGTIEEDFTPGKLTFIKDGKDFSLLPTSAGEGLFIIFADQTSGEETYGAGRFLYAEKPDSSGSVILDFNKAYNPPCAFSKYATCPLPPKENYLKLRISAGEKNYGKH